MSRFSPFPRHQIFKHQKRSLLSTNLLVLVPTAVMATSFKFNLLKTKIKNFPGRTKSISYSRGDYFNAFSENYAPLFTACRVVETAFFSLNEGLPGVWGNKGTWPISRGTEKKNLREHGNLETVLRITGTNIVNIVKGICQKKIEIKT